MTERVVAASVPVRPAATVMLVRDGDGGLEVFMVQRTHAAAFARSQYVFPGGRVDEADHHVDFEPVVDGVDDATASSRLGLDAGGLAWLVAAIRECFEEAGVLLAKRRGADTIVRFDADGVADRFGAARHAIHDGDRSLVDLCLAEDLVLLVGDVHVVAHWITPIGERRRFDTRFFVAKAPDGQVPLHDDRETIASLWVRPDDALAMWSRKELQMFPPTVAALRQLGTHATADGAVEAARVGGVPPALLPRLVLDAGGRFVDIVLPGDATYESTPIPDYVFGR